MNKIIKYIFTSILLLGIFSFWVEAAGFNPSDILPTTSTGTIADVAFDTNGDKLWSTNLLDKMLAFVKDSIFWLLGLVAIGMFLYVWFSLIKAQWNPEELKKAFMTLIHVIIGLFIVAISWAIIKMVSGLTF